jgi:proline dehydrogenase
LTVVDPLRSGLLWASENAVLRRHLPTFRFVRATVDRFMPGEGAEDALAAARRLMEADGLPVTFTRLGENVTELAQAADAAGDYLRTLDRIAELGLDAEISVKLTQLGFDLDPDVTATHVERLVDRSAELGRTCWIDMESTHYVEGTIDLYERELARSPNVGLCLQAYLRRTYDDIQRLLPAAPTIRLVKGAYREPKDVAFQSKSAIDESYFRLASHLVKGGARRVALGSHDTKLIERIDTALGGHDGFEIAMLYGIRTDEQRRLHDEGYDVRTLISYGPSWYPWFMRRIAEKPVENTLLALRNLV